MKRLLTTIALLIWCYAAATGFSSSHYVRAGELVIWDNQPAGKWDTAYPVGNGRLCKRPIVTDGKVATVGFKEDDFAGKWG